MTCECYKIGGPFIAEDPDCEVHGVNGYYARLEKADEEIGRLRTELQEARNVGIEASAKVLDSLMYDYGCCAGVDAAEMASLMAKIATAIRQLKGDQP